MTELDDVAREVRTRDQRRVADVLERALVGAVDADLVELRRHAHGARIAAAAHMGEAVDQRLEGRIEAEGDDMHRLVVAPGHRNLRAVEELHAQGVGLGARLNQPADLVVVGQRQQFDAVAMGATHHGGRREQAVGNGRMAVEIGVQKVVRRKVAHSTLPPLHHFAAAGIIRDGRRERVTRSPPKAQSPGIAQAKGPTTQQESEEWRRCYPPAEGGNLSGAKDRWGEHRKVLALFHCRETTRITTGKSLSHGKTHPAV